MMLTKSVVALVAATAVLGPCDPSGSVRPPKDISGTWGGENAALIADDTSAHVHIGCTYGNIPQQIVPDEDGRFDVPGVKKPMVEECRLELAGDQITIEFPSGNRMGDRKSTRLNSSHS